MASTAYVCLNCSHRQRQRIACERCDCRLLRVEWDEELITPVRADRERFDTEG
jgi:hypothetical protein